MSEPQGKSGGGLGRLLDRLSAERRTAIETALQGLRRYPLRTGLTLAGLAFGVAALLTTIALGRGAQDAIRQQVRAAGLNVIEVTAGNYRTRGERPLGGSEAPTRHGAVRPPGVLERVLRVAVPVALAHPENDPMEKHDHPTAAERLGDSAAGLGAAATLTRDDADAVAPSLRRRPCGFRGARERAGVERRAALVPPASHGTDVDLVEIRRSLRPPARTDLQRRRARAAPPRWWSSGAWRAISSSGRTRIRWGAR